VILNVWVVSALFLAAVGAVLAAGAAVTALRDLADRGGAAAAERAPLLLLIVVVLLLVRALAWPHFYLLLESFVPALAPQGVMCVYGVTRVAPGLVLALQWLKPAVVALLAAWWILVMIDQRTEGALRDQRAEDAPRDQRNEGAPLRRLRSVAIVPLALLALAECAIEGIYLASDKLGRPVTCCSQPADLTGRAIAASPSPLALAGFDTAEKTLAAYALLNVVVVALAFVLARRRAAARAPHAPLAPLAAIALVVLACANLVVAQWAWLDAVAPRVLGLPYHHCLYEVVTRAPAMGLAAILTIGGNLAAAGAPLLRLLRRRAPAAVDDVTRALLRFAALALASALLVVAVHLV